MEQTAKLGAQPCGGTGCYTNYVALADLDGDKDLDIALPSANGYFVKAQPAQPLVILRNDGKDGALAFVDASDSLAGGLSGWVRQIAIGDIDGDGDLDIFAPDAWGAADALFINDGKGSFTNEAATRVGGSHSRAGSTRFGDVDSDGDLDLLIGDWGTTPPKGAWSVHLLVNDGMGSFTPDDARLPTATKPDGTGPVDLDLLDYDGDFDLDILVNAHNGNLQLWTNDGQGTFADASASFPNQPVGLHYNPAVCDVDGDGDLDVFVDNGTASEDEQLLINGQVQAAPFKDETAARVMGNASGADDNGVACVDVDGDGDFDAVIASLSGNERVLINDGTGHFAASPDAFPVVADATLWIDFGDLDGDGKLDAVTGQGESGSFINRLYTAAGAAPADMKPPKFRAVETTSPPGGATTTGQGVIVHFAVSDNAVTDTGPRLSAVEVEVTTTTSASVEKVKATFMGGDLFRAALPPSKKATTVTWRACATDRNQNRACTEPARYAVTGDDLTTPDGGGASADGGAGGADGGTSAGTTTTTSGCAIAIRAGQNGGMLLLLLAFLGLVGVRARRR